MKPHHKVLTVALILIVPLALVIFTFTPIIKNSQKKVASGTYNLPEGFTRQDIGIFVNQMKSDREFFFYFALLSLNEDSMDEIVNKAYQLLDANRGKQKHYELIVKLHSGIENTARLINSLNYSDDFLLAPGKHLLLSRALLSFLEEEFELTIIGLSYKTLYDKKFQFQWSESAVQAAMRFERIVVQMGDEQRKELMGIRR